MENHFQGITPKERYDNDLLNEMRKIRGLLERGQQSIQEVNPANDQIKRSYNRRK